MPEFQISRESLEARDAVSDCDSIAQRIESYRHLYPTDNPKLIVASESADAVPVECCIPEVTLEELSADCLRSALAEHGALIVRNMFSQEEADTLVGAIDHVLDACGKSRVERANLSGTYHNPPANMLSIMPNKGMELGSLRMFNNASGAAMCVEAPSVAETLLQLYEEHGVQKLVGDYLGEPACLSVKKWVLRRSKLPVDKAGWHQDGAFMGTDINSINMWIPLTECGGETGAPGMDVVPERLHEVASSDGATFDWSVSDEYIDSSAFKSQPVAPVFGAGDAMFFDHLYLHRTQSRDDFTKVRYAVETWFFGASTFPKDQIPMAW